MRSSRGSPRDTDPVASSARTTYIVRGEELALYTALAAAGVATVADSLASDGFLLIHYKFSTHIINPRN